MAARSRRVPVARPPRARRSVLVALVALGALLVAPSPAGARTGPPWMNRFLPADVRAGLLAREMTLDEKIELMTGDQGAAPAAFYNGPIPRLGIPELRMADAGAGIAPRGWTLPGTGAAATALPAGIALGATFDPDTARLYADTVTREARATGHAVLLGPNADIIRLPWWGRAAETESEDPLLTARLVTPYVQAVQRQPVIADLKHYNVYNQETNRGSGVNAVIDERALQEIYVRPWVDVVRDADVGSVMCSFNKLNGVYACENPLLLAEILREQARFKGFVLTDFGALHDTVGSATAGTDMETGTRSGYDGALLAAVNDGRVPVAVLDAAVHRILRTMFAFGVFDTTYEAGTIDVDAGAAVAQRVEEQAITLLKNDGGALPLDPAVRSIAVIGGDAGIPAALGGASRVQPARTITPLQGIQDRAAAAGASVTWAPGVDPVNAASMLPGPPAVPSSVLGAPGGGAGLQAEYFATADLSGAPVLVRTDAQVTFDAGFLSNFSEGNLNPGQVPPPPAETQSVRYTGTFTAPATGDYTLALTGWGDAQVFLDGALVADMTGQADLRSVVSPTLALTAGQPHALRVEFRLTHPLTGLDPGTLQLGWTYPAGARSPGIQQAADAAAAADVAVVFARTFEGEQRDRANLTLPQDQDALIAAVRARNPRTVVVLATGGPVTMPWLGDVPAVVQTYFGGEAQGAALARVLFGDVNPSGRLPITYPASETAVPPGIANPVDTRGDVDVAYADGPFVGYRGYQQAGIEPLFAFGHGLSYTSFSYRGLIASGGSFWHPPFASVVVRNTGDRRGTEVVQVYAGRLPTAVPTPPRQLAGFAKVTLDPGRSARVLVPLDERSLSYWDAAAHRWVRPPGFVALHAGGSSADIGATTWMWNG
jgi:beta-glucosidase